MWPLDEHGRPIIYVGPFESGTERERWVMVLDGNSVPQRLLQEYETPHATQYAKSFVRSSRTVEAEHFFSAELPKEVRIKLYKFLQDQGKPTK